MRKGGRETEQEGRKNVNECPRDDPTENTRCLRSHSYTQVQVLTVSQLQVLSLSQPVRSFSLSFWAHQQSITISLSSQKADRSHPWKRGGKKRHPPSNTVYAEWSCALWWQSIYTWEEGNWYCDRSNIAANEGLLPGKLEKRWWTVEEIYQGLTIKNVEEKLKSLFKCIFEIILKWYEMLVMRVSDMWAFRNNAQNKLYPLGKNIVFLALLPISIVRYIYEHSVLQKNQRQIFPPHIISLNFLFFQNTYHII